MWSSLDEQNRLNDIEYREELHEWRENGRHGSKPQRRFALSPTIENADALYEQNKVGDSLSLKMNELTSRKRRKAMTEAGYEIRREDLEVYKRRRIDELKSSYKLALTF